MKKKVGIIGFGKMGQIRLKVIKKTDIFEDNENVHYHLCP